MPALYASAERIDRELSDTHLPKIHDAVALPLHVPSLWSPMKPARHPTALRTFETVWAAGGTPFAVFLIRPDSVLSTWPGARIRLPRARRLVRRSKLHPGPVDKLLDHLIYVKQYCLRNVRPSALAVGWL